MAVKRTPWEYSHPAPVIGFKSRSNATETDLGASPSGSVKVTPNETVVPTIAMVGETDGSLSLPSELPIAVPTPKARSNSANSGAIATVMGSRPKRLTAASVMVWRMGRQGGVGNGTAVMAPGTLAGVEPIRDRSAPLVRPIARHHKCPQPHCSDRRRGSAVRWAQPPQVPSGGAHTHRP